VVTLSNSISVGAPGAAMVTGAIAKVTRRRRQNKGGICIASALSK
jgi:hypothetical protein